ncbi:MAG TPA: sigma-70 family RNA polymerase sigma factor [Burkholderiaceae bacterium]|nr:sigma-70 family RNA polymerase sigma factor [Burkholderiaceae bacterium]
MNRPVRTCNSPPNPDPRAFSPLEVQVSGQSPGRALYFDRPLYTREAMENERVSKLLERIARQDQAAFQELYKAFSRKVFAYVLNQLKDQAKAEEVLVDTMYEVWRNPTRFRGESAFSTWLIGIARNKALLVYRSRRPDEDHADLDDVAEITPDEGPDGYARLAEQQRREGVQHCMGKLSEEHRECLHLVFYEGMSLAEVAAIQRCPENTVKTRLFHARQRIKNCLRLLLEREGSAPGVES